MFNEIKTSCSGSCTVTKFVFDTDYKADFEETVSRFFCTAAMLRPGALIGIQVVCTSVGKPAAYLFSDSDADQDDLAWIAEDDSVVRPAEPWTPEISEMPGGKVYIAVPAARTAESGSLRGRARKPDLIRMMRGEDAVVRILAGQDGQGGARALVMIGFPGEMTLRMRTALSVLLPGMLMVEAGGTTVEEPVNAALTAVEQQSDAAECLEAYARFAAGLLKRASAACEEVPRRYSDDLKLEEMDLSIRTFNCLKRAGIHTLGGLRRLSGEDMKKIRNLGKKSIAEIRQKLKEFPVSGFAEDSIGYDLDDWDCEAPLDDLTCESLPDDLTVSPESMETDGIPVDPMAALNEMVGLSEVKDQVRKIAALARMKKEMEAGGRPEVHVNLSMAFVGNPGTAKTSTARVLVGIFHSIGLLESSEIIEAGRADLVAGYVGQTAEKVKKLFASARGHLLFIDEAYSLLDDGRGEFGDEAINTIVQEMENHREETIVIFAGYPGEMDEFLERNPGLKSRIPFRISFRDYSAEEMMEIVRIEAGRRGFEIAPKAEGKLAAICADAAEDPAAGNGRFCRNLAEGAILSFAGRVYGADGGQAVCCAAAEGFVLEAGDFGVPCVRTGKRVPMGFGGGRGR